MELFDWAAFGEEIRRHRIAYGLSQAQLAELAALSRAQIYLIEVAKGKGGMPLDPRMSSVIKILAALRLRLVLQPGSADEIGFMLERDAQGSPGK